jgi:hypothetical protein
MLELLEELFLECELTFDAKDCRIMCFPHTINIAVQHVLDKMSLIKASENDNDNDPEDLNDMADKNVQRTRSHGCARLLGQSALWTVSQCLYDMD